MVLTPLLLFLLGCLVAYVATVEVAFSALMKFSFRFEAERSGRLSLLNKYLDEPIQLLVPARVIRGIVVSLVAVLFVKHIESASWESLGIFFLSVVTFVLVCENIIPLLLVGSNPKRVLEVVLPPFVVIAGFFEPVSNIVIRWTGRSRRRRDEGVKADLETATSAVITNKENDEVNADFYSVEQEGNRLLRLIVNFSNTLVRVVMTPRPDVVAVDSEVTLAELRSLFAEQEYSRIPVFRGNLDNVVGFVFAKDLIHLTGTTDEVRPIAELLRPAYVVPEGKRVAELLKEFQRRQVQSAIVVDEYGGTAGVVTIEDLLEEIVGEIRDEYDIELEPIVDERGDSFVFSGNVDIAKVSERLRVDIGREGFETVGGYLLSYLGRVPVAGESFDIDTLRIEVLDAERRRVNRVRISRRPEINEYSTKEEPSD